MFDPSRGPTPEQERRGWERWVSGHVPHFRVSSFKLKGPRKEGRSCPGSQRQIHKLMKDFIVTVRVSGKEDGGVSFLCLTGSRI